MHRDTIKKVVAFNSSKYLALQTRAIQERVLRKKAEKVYIEFGGKIFDDMHAARVLPGYWPDMKLQIIKRIFKEAEIIFTISAKDILRKRIRGDHKITYDLETLRLVRNFKKAGVPIKHVVITRVPNTKLTPGPIQKFKNKLKRKGLKIKELKEDLEYVNPKKDWSSYDKSDFLKTKKRYVVILSPGGGSGKFGVCLNQLYHEMQGGVTPFYIKFETFPVHDLSVLHPVNLAYMAASADFYDLVMKDPRDKKASSYNRDVENYELLHYLARHFKKKGVLLRKITSATNMGVNVLSKAVLNWEEVEKEAVAEIGRRLIRYKYEVQRKQERPEIVSRIKRIMSLVYEA